MGFVSACLHVEGVQEFLTPTFVIIGDYEEEKYVEKKAIDFFEKTKQHIKLRH